MFSLQLTLAVSNIQTQMYRKVFVIIIRVLKIQGEEILARKCRVRLRYTKILYNYFILKQLSLTIIMLQGNRCT